MKIRFFVTHLSLYHYLFHNATIIFISNQKSVIIIYNIYPKRATGDDE